MSRKRTLKIYTFAFLAIVAVGFFVLVRNHISLIFYKDGIGQYYPAFLYIGQYLRNFLFGNHKLHFYDLSIALGENVISVLNYYGLGDPINLLAIFANEQNGAHIYAATYFIRLWLAGFFFQRYCLKIGIRNEVTIAASLMYAFCGFSIYDGSHYIPFTTMVILFPLLLIGTEDVFRARKISVVLIVATAYGAVCSYYFLFATSLIVGAYWIVRIHYIYGWTKTMNAIRSMACLVISYALGLFLAAPIFLPAVVGALNSSRVSEIILSNALELRKYIPAMNEALLKSFTFQKLSNLSFILVAEYIAVFLLLFIHNRKSRQLKVALLIILVALHFPITGFIFDGFDAWYDRWVFSVHFIMALVFAYVLSNVGTVSIETKSSKSICWKYKDVVLVTSILVVTNIAINVYATYSYAGIDRKTQMVSLNDVSRNITSPVTQSKVITDDEDLFRVSNTTLTNIHGRPENVAMLNDYNGTTWWFSVVNGDSQRIADELAGGDAASHRNYGFQNNSLYEAFSGVKYYLCRDSESASGHGTLIDQVTFNDESWNVYRNPYYFGMAYIRDGNQTLLIDECKISMEDYYRKVYTSFILDHHVVASQYLRYEDRLVFTVDQPQNDELVALIPYDKNWHAYVDGVETAIRKADIGYMAVTINQDTQEIVFRYVPREFYIGCVLMAIAIIYLLYRGSRRIYARSGEVND